MIFTKLVDRGAIDGKIRLEIFYPSVVHISMQARCRQPGMPGLRQGHPPAGRGQLGRVADGDAPPAASPGDAHLSWGF